MKSMLVITNDSIVRNCQACSNTRVHRPAKLVSKEMIAVPGYPEEEKKKKKKTGAGLILFGSSDLRSHAKIDLDARVQSRIERGSSAPDQPCG